MPINQMWWFAQYTTPVFTATSTSCVLSFTMFTNIANMDNEMIVDRIELGIMTTPQIQQYTLAGSTSQVPITTTIADGDFELLRNSRNAGATTSTTTLVTVNGFIGSWSYSLTANAGTGSCYLVQHGVNSALYATLSTISPVSGNFQLTMYVRLAGGIYSIVNNIGPLIVGQQYNLSYWHATKSVLNATISVSICGVNYVAPVPTLNAFTQVFFPFVAPSTYCVLNYTSIFGSQQVAQLLSLDLFQLTTIFTVPSLVGTYSVPVQNTYNGLDLTSVAVNAGKLYVGTNPGSTTQYQAPVCTAFQFTVGGSLSNTFTSTCPTSNNAITSIFAANSKLLIGNAVMNEIDVTSGSIIRTIGSTVSAANITTFAMNNNYLLASQDNGITLAWFVPELVSGSFVGAVNGPVCLAT